MSESGLNLKQNGLLEAVGQAAGAVVVTGADGIIQYVNPAFTAMTGYSREEAIGQNPRLVKSGCQPEAFYRRMWETIRSGMSWQGDLVNRRKDGKLYTEEMRIAPIRDPQGAISGYLAIKRDVTGQRAAEQAQALLASIVASSEDGICSADLEGNILSCNRGAEKLLGYASEELIGRNLALVLPSQRRERLREILESVAKGGAVSPYDAILLAKDDSRVDVSFSISAIRNAEGAVVGVSGIARSIGERLKTERLLAESEKRFRRVFEQAPIGIAATTMDGRIVMANAAFCSIMGYSEGELLKKRWADLTHKDDLSVTQGILERLLLAPGESGAAEKRYIRGDGRMIWGHVTISLMRDGDGKPLHHLVHVQDITEHKQNRDSLQFHHSLIRAIHEVLLDGILVINDANLIVSHNQRFKDIWHFPDLEIPENLPDYFIGDQPPRVLSAVMEQVKKPEAFLRRIQELNEDPDAIDHCEIELRDGRTIERYSASLHIEGGNHRGRVWFFREITERKRIDSALRESEARYRSTFEQAAVGILHVSAEGKILECNARFAEITGYSTEEAAGLSFQQITHPDDMAACVGLHGKVMNEESPPPSLEKRYIRKDGTITWVKVTPTIRRDRLLRSQYHITIVEDINDRKMAEEALREAHEFAKSTIDALTSHICVLDESGVIIAVNRAWQEFARLNRRQADGQDGDREACQLRRGSQLSGSLQSSGGTGSRPGRGVRHRHPFRSKRKKRRFLRWNIPATPLSRSGGFWAVSRASCTTRCRWRWSSTSTSPRVSWRRRRSASPGRRRKRNLRAPTIWPPKRSRPPSPKASSWPTSATRFAPR